MDQFDKKISKMKNDISEIDKEIKEIQKVSLSDYNIILIIQKNRVAKENLSRKIESLRNDSKEKTKKEPFNLKYSKLDNYSIKSFRNNYKKNLIKNEDNSENDINTINHKKNDELNNIIINQKKNLTKSKKMFNSELNNNNYKNIYSKGKNNSKNNNIINNYIIKKLYQDEKEKSINNTSNDINKDFNMQNNNNKEIHEKHTNYNNRQINKSKSYFMDNNCLNKYRNKKELNKFINPNQQTIASNYNNKTTTNYRKNINIFNQKSRVYNPFKIRNKKGFKHKIYCGLEYNGNKYLGNNFSDKDSSDSMSIDDLINKVNYKGDKDNFPKYIEELKLKADITTLVQNMFKNEINSYDGLEKFLQNYSKKKYEKILNMYKFLLGRLIQMNQKENNDKQLDSFYDEIYSFQPQNYK